MVQPVQPPDPRQLLPPLLACLPASFASPRPPPALTLLLTPILRQRLHALTSEVGSDSWLPLLTWDREQAPKLQTIVENIQLEPHPASGEIEIPEPDRIEFRRFDPETLHSRLRLEELGLSPIYLWCTGDGKSNNQGWKLHDLRLVTQDDDEAQWHGSLADAEAKYEGQRAVSSNGTRGTGGLAVPSAGPESTEDDDDDDGYWAAYDRTPGRTPLKQSPAPSQNANSSVKLPTGSEVEYFARYMEEVQPALDPDDPSEEGLAPGESTLNGDTVLSSGAFAQNESGVSDAAYPSHGGGETNGTATGEIHQPRPSSPSSSSSIEQLERQAENQSQAEVGIKQHISTDIKSLFRLARSAGIQRGEFERIVKTELELLSIMDLDE
ncbi:hypothetical protein EJ06DRAFT_537949 [Trichodelitschia bisporula]|uniref:Uncharacterized protein n=1 Tax=Trichodelitschia bisporula TaxID=703511 RepID=A0A6G1HWI5_9PEZI|nr:hypothetical protein EJ06DRAFT_537949 [Trichodelitschia bisporula]